jgi:tetratricopeptide (TPR) repeat protein
VLADALAAAVDGSGRLVLVLGEPGIGKTTFARDAASSARRKGVAVRWAACASGVGGFAHAPWLTVLSGLGLEGRRAMEALVGAGAAVDLDAGAAAAARGAAYAAVVSALEVASDARPVVIVLDDLHWADEGSLALLEVVAAHVPGMRVVIVGTYRPTDVATGTPLTRLGGGSDRVELRGMDRAGVAELLATHLGPGRSEELADQVHRFTAGNPFLVVQLGRLLADEPEALVRDLLPSGARDLLEQRLEVLTSSDREVLVAAATLGSPFRAGDVSSLLASEPAMIDDALTRAAGLLIVERAPGTGMWAFVHDLFRQAVLQVAEPTAVVDLHGRAATVLEQGDAEPAAIAAHLLEAGGAHAEDAARWSVHAGERALAILAWEEAAAQFGRALAAETGGDDDLRAAALAGLGRSRLLCGDEARAAEAFAELAALGRRLGSATLLANAALGWSADIAGFEVRLFDQRQIDLLEEAAQVLAGDDRSDLGLRATVLARLSVALSLVAPDERRLALVEEAVALARRADDPTVLARVLAAHCDAIAGPDRCEDREAEATEIIAISEAAADRVLELLGRRLRYAARLEQGDLRGVEEDVAAFARRAETLGNPLYRWYVPLWQAQASVVAADLDAARAGIAEVDRLGRLSGSTNAPLLAFVLGLAISNAEGDYRGAIDALAAFTDGSPDLAPFVSSLGAMALVHLRAGRHVEARSILDRAEALGLDSVPFDAEWLPNATSIVQAAAGLDHEILDEALALLEPWAHRISFEGIGAGLYGSTARFVAIGCAALGRHDDAVRSAEAALVVNRRLGGTLLPDALRTLAEVLEQRDGVNARSQKAHAEADETYASLGCAHLVRGSVPGIRPGVPAAPAPEPETEFEPNHAPVNELRRAGDVWHITYAGTEVVVRHSKGIGDLAILLCRPGSEVHVGELEDVPRALTASSGGEALDRRAIAAYKERLAELAAELDDADAAHDLARAELARIEYDALVEQLSTSVGLGGRSRPAGPEPVDRLRKAVSARVRDARRKIGDVHPALGRHLDNAVHTGIYCVYRPEVPTNWRCQS